MKIEQLIVQYLYNNKSVTLQNIGTFEVSDDVRLPLDNEKDAVLPDNAFTFKYNPRVEGVNYSVTAAKGAAGGTLKQLGIIALNDQGDEMGRTYYVVYPNAKTGHTSERTVQSTLGSQDIIGTYEEDAVNGGYDSTYKNAYWLYINEANENDFKGKAIPLDLYNADIKSLKFEVRENTELIENSVHELSSGIGFFYKGSNGEALQIKQNQIIPVSGLQYSLYYGKPGGALGTEVGVKPSRTRVVYSQAKDDYLVIFDPSWKTADVQVYDMSGKLIISQKNIVTSNNFDIKLSKSNSAYIVTAVSESGDQFSSKIIR